MDRTEKVIIGIIMALIFIGIFIYFADKAGLLEMNKPSTYFYSNGDSEFEVRQVSQENYVGYQIKFYEGDVPKLINLRYDPLSLEDIEIDRAIFHKIIDDTTTFITINPNANLTGKTTIAALEINKNIEYFFHIPVNSSMTESYSNYPVKSCEDASKEESVIWLKLGDETKITSEGNCITIEGKTQEDLIRAADRLSLYMIGIMP
jgi:hypothetical protein